MNFLRNIVDRVFDRAPRHKIHVKTDKNGEWRVHISDPSGERMTLMSGVSIPALTDALAHAREIKNARFDIIIHQKSPSGGSRWASSEDRHPPK